jgi:hypothetical protein
MESQYGVSLSKLNQICSIAVQAQDKPVAAELLKRIGDNWDSKAWSKNDFVAARLWAFAPDKQRPKRTVPHRAKIEERRSTV